MPEGAAEVGPPGAVGPIGPKGDTGAQGAVGPSGPQGAKGDTGATGSQGPQGVVGSTGPSGPQGPAGATGPQGVAGVNATTAAVATTTTDGLMSATDKVKLGKMPVTTFVGTAEKTVGTTGIIGLAGVETSLVPTGKGSMLIPSAIFDSEGYSFHFKAAGRYSNNVAGIVTLRIRLSGTQTLALSSLQLPAVTNRVWIAEGSGTVRSGRVLISHASLEYDDGTAKLEGAMFTSSTVVIPAGDKTADMTAQWAVNILASSFTVEQMFLSYTPAP